ncbi:SHOCT domain-containing protein [Luteipulveratus mongoliensis]|nr:SHOCT domain-containing protein [Luteipulveratus mongoliensis]
MDWNDGAGVGWVAVCVGVLGVLLLAVSVVMMRLLYRPTPPLQDIGPEEALRSRFARGEIDAEKLDRALTVLATTPSDPTRSAHLT